MNTLPIWSLVGVSLLFALRCDAQLEQKPLKGTFYISVDDAATLFVNGTKVFETGIGDSRSPELELKTGDRVVAHLRDDGGVRRFVIAFASTDGHTVVNFRNHDFKIVPEADLTDFTAAQFEKWTKYAKDLRQKAGLPVKSSSESVWGDLNKSILGSLVTSKMIAERSK